MLTQGIKRVQESVVAQYLRKSHTLLERLGKQVSLQQFFVNIFLLPLKASDTQVGDASAKDRLSVSSQLLGARQKGENAGGFSSVLESPGGTANLVPGLSISFATHFEGFSCNIFQHHRYLSCKD